MKQATFISVESPPALAGGDEVRVYVNVRNDGDEISTIWIASYDTDDPRYPTFTSPSKIKNVQPNQIVSVPMTHYGKWQPMPAKELHLYIHGGYEENNSLIQQFEYYLTIKLTTEPAPKEGLANIWKVDVPTRLFPGDKVNILSYICNKGLWGDDIWCNLIDLDTNEVLVRKVYNASSHQCFIFDMSDNILMPDHNFRLRLSAGHDPYIEPDSVKDITIYLSPAIKAAIPIVLTFGGIIGLILIGLMLAKR